MIKQDQAIIITAKQGRKTMATITTINATDDLETTSRETINDNFDALNTDKVEGTLDIDGTLAANSDAKVPSQKAVKTYTDTKIASTALDTDDTLAADSDAKVPSQKAVKAYVDTLAATKVALTGDETIAGRKAFTGTITFSILPTIPTPPTADTHAASKKYVDDAVGAGGSDADETTKGVVEEATDAETAAGTATGGTGAKLFVSPAKFKAMLDTDEALTANSDTKIPTQQAVKAYADALYPAFVSSANLRESNDAELGDRSLSYTPSGKSTRINAPMVSCTIKFSMRAENAGDTAYAKIYKNAVALGTEQTTTSGSAVEKSETFTGLACGDVITIYVKGSNDGVGHRTLISNLRFYFDRAAVMTHTA